MLRVVFMGSADLSAIMLEMLVASDTVQVVGAVTQPDKPAGRNKKLTPCPCKAFVDTHHIPCLAPTNVNTQESITQIAAWMPDVIVVVAYGQFLSRKLLSIPPMGCINIHLSLLPRHRGASPIHAALLAGDKQTGVTAMLMDEGMDTGAILQTSTTPIEAQDTCETLQARLSHMGGELLIDTLAQWEAHTLMPHPQDNALSTVAYKIRKTDGLLHWDESTEKNVRKLRAFTPWPSCYTFMPDGYKDSGKMIKIHTAQMVPLTPYEVTSLPGTLLRIEKTTVQNGVQQLGGYVVKTQDGALLLTRIQVEGGKPVAVVDFHNGHPLKPGDRFTTPAKPEPVQPKAFSRSIAHV